MKYFKTLSIMVACAAVSNCFADYNADGNLCYHNEDKSACESISTGCQSGDTIACSNVAIACYKGNSSLCKNLSSYCGKGNASACHAIGTVANTIATACDGYHDAESDDNACSALSQACLKGNVGACDINAQKCASGISSHCDSVTSACLGGIDVACTAIGDSASALVSRCSRDSDEYACKALGIAAKKGSNNTADAVVAACANGKSATKGSFCEMAYTACKNSDYACSVIDRHSYKIGHTMCDKNRDQDACNALGQSCASLNEAACSRAASLVVAGSENHDSLYKTLLNVRKSHAGSEAYRDVMNNSDVKNKCNQHAAENPEACKLLCGSKTCL